MRRASGTSATPLIRIDPRARSPRFRQICEQLRAAILAGRLVPGAALPSTRALAAELSVARNTVKQAYEQLAAEGFLEARSGAATRVAAGSLPRRVARESAQAARGGGAARPTRRLARRMRALLDLRGLDYGPGITRQVGAFRIGRPALDAFPLEIWARLAGRRWRHASAGQLGYADPRGEARLREAIAAWISASRGVRCDPERILVVGGSQEGLDLAARVLLDPGDATWLEDPGYFGARAAATAAGARLVPVPVDGEGLDVAAGRRRASGARVAFVTPSHQFPLGVTLSLARRLALLDWARASGGWIVEDDYDCEFRYDARPLAALQGMDDHDRVLYLGTFSKTLFPALRLGFLVLPEDLVAPFVATRAVLDHHGPTLDQLVLADFIAEGHYARHLRRMRALYKERQDVLVREVRDRCAGLLELVPTDAGMHVVAWLAEGLDEAAVVAGAERAGVAVLPLAASRLEPGGRGGLLLGFGATPPSVIRDAVGRLAGVLRQASPPRRKVRPASAAPRRRSRIGTPPAP